MKFLVLLAIVGFAAAQIQIQVPVQRPQQPQPPQQQPQWPSMPQQPPRAPIAPRATWRNGVFDSRCPNPDDHEGLAFFLPGNGQADFFICWGTIAWPFFCPPTTVWWHEQRTCALPAQIPQRIRPFSEDGEEE